MGENSEFRIQNSEFRIQNSEYRIQKTEWRMSTLLGWARRYGWITDRFDSALASMMR
jgi:hypothetical protein